MKVIALMPARTGSKRIPDKNIKPLLGKPLLNYVIEAALQCKSIEAVYVNIDSEQYLDIGDQFDAKR